MNDIPNPVNNFQYAIYVFGAVAIVGWLLWLKFGSSSKITEKVESMQREIIDHKTTERTERHERQKTMDDTFIKVFGKLDDIRDSVTDLRVDMAQDYITKEECNRIHK